MAQSCARRGVEDHLADDGPLWAAQPFRPSRRRSARLLPRLVQGPRRYRGRSRLPGGRNAICDPDLSRLRRSGAARGDAWTQRWRAGAPSPSMRRKRGLEFLFWEPMSVGRELGHTIADDARACRIAWIAADLAIPLKAMIDIDHGDVSSPDPADTDPYAWASAFAARSPIIHIKQSSANKGGHWPFTAEHNRDGRIVPERLIEAIRAGRRRRQRILHGIRLPRTRARRPQCRRDDPRIGRTSGSPLPTSGGWTNGGLAQPPEASTGR